jgi:hypothetical protein
VFCVQRCLFSVEKEGYQHVLNRRDLVTVQYWYLDWQSPMRDDWFKHCSGLWKIYMKAGSLWSTHSCLSKPWPDYVLMVIIIFFEFLKLIKHCRTFQSRNWCAKVLLTISLDVTQNHEGGSCQRGSMRQPGSLFIFIFILNLVQITGTLCDLWDAYNIFAWEVFQK